MTTRRIDPKTRRWIISDFTPSIRGVLDESNDYADLIASSLLDIKASADKQLKTLEEILKQLEKVNS